MPEPTTPKRTRKNSGHTQTINLRSGGTLTLSGTFNLFTMSTEDVEFVSELGGQIRRYNEAQALGSARSPGRPAPQGTGLPRPQ